MDREKSFRQFSMPYFVFVFVVGSRKSGNYQLTLLKGYGKYYEKKYKKPLPVDLIVKMKELFLHCVERRCAELLLTVADEAAWTLDADLLDKIDLSDSGKESKDHSRDDVIFDSRSNSNNDSEDDDSEN
jgi:hypothetical protein